MREELRQESTKGDQELPPLPASADPPPQPTQRNDESPDGRRRPLSPLAPERRQDPGGLPPPERRRPNPRQFSDEEEEILDCRGPPLRKYEVRDEDRGGPVPPRRGKFDDDDYDALRGRRGAPPLRGRNDDYDDDDDGQYRRVPFPPGRYDEGDRRVRPLPSGQYCDKDEDDRRPNPPVQRRRGEAPPPSYYDDDVEDGRAVRPPDPSRRRGQSPPPELDSDEEEDLRGGGRDLGPRAKVGLPPQAMARRPLPHNIDEDEEYHGAQYVSRGGRGGGRGGRGGRGAFHPAGEGVAEERERVPRLPPRAYSDDDEDDPRIPPMRMSRRAPIMVVDSLRRYDDDRYDDDDEEDRPLPPTRRAPIYSLPHERQQAGPPPLASRAQQEDLSVLRRAREGGVWSRLGAPRGSGRRPAVGGQADDDDRWPLQAPEELKATSEDKKDSSEVKSVAGEAAPDQPPPHSSPVEDKAPTVAAPGNGKGANEEEEKGEKKARVGHEVPPRDAREAYAQRNAVPVPPPINRSVRRDWTVLGYYGGGEEGEEERHLPPRHPRDRGGGRGAGVGDRAPLPARVGVERREYADDRYEEEDLPPPRCAPGRQPVSLTRRQGEDYLPPLRDVAHDRRQQYDDDDRRYNDDFDDGMQYGRRGGRPLRRDREESARQFDEVRVRKGQQYTHEQYRGRGRDDRRGGGRWEEEDVDDDDRYGPPIGGRRLPLPRRRDDDYYDDDDDGRPVAKRPLSVKRDRPSPGPLLASGSRRREAGPSDFGDDDYGYEGGGRRRREEDEAWGPPPSRQPPARRKEYADGDGGRSEEWQGGRKPAVTAAGGNKRSGRRWEEEEEEEAAGKVDNTRDGGDAARKWADGRGRGRGPFQVDGEDLSEDTGARGDGGKSRGPNQRRGHVDVDLPPARGDQRRYTGEDSRRSGRVDDEPSMRERPRRPDVDLPPSRADKRRGRIDDDDDDRSPPPSTRRRRYESPGPEDRSRRDGR